MLTHGTMWELMVVIPCKYYVKINRTATETTHPCSLHKTKVLLYGYYVFDKIPSLILDISF